MLINGNTELYNIDFTTAPNGSSTQSSGAKHPNSVVEYGLQQEGQRAQTQNTTGKGILKIALKLLSKLFGNEAVAATKDTAKLGGTAAATSAQSTLASAEITQMVNELSNTIGAQTSNIQAILDLIKGELTEELTQQQLLIQAEIDKITALQETLKTNDKLSDDDKLNILAEMDACANNILDIIENSSALQAKIQEKFAEVEQAQTEVDELKNISVEQVEAYTQELAETTVETTEGTAEATAMGVEAGINTANGASLEAGAAAVTAGTLGVGAGVGVQMATKGGQNIIAGGTRGVGATVNATSFLATLGSLTGTNEILNAFNQYIGAETGNLVGFLGEASTLLQDKITSVGSIATGGAKAVEATSFKSAIANDIQIVNSGDKKAALESPEFKFSDFGI